MTGYDVVIVGSGVAGLSTALGLADTRRVAVVTSGEFGGGSTRWAQGGIAAALGPADTPALHAADTTAAGAGFCDDDIVNGVTEQAAIRLRDLLATGASFDRDAAGHLTLAREGGHQRHRVAHAGGDATGAEVSRALVAAVRRTGIDIVEHSTVVDIQLGRGPRGSQVTGVRLRPTGGTSANSRVLEARAVVLATGGVGGVFATSTNPPEVTGDGLAIALRAGASLVDLEFVQFHPTALRTSSAPGQIPLITEALRGAGAVLRDRNGEPIMAGVHPMGDLAPRDVVARRIAEVIAAEPNGRLDHVLLDATHLDERDFRTRFPTVLQLCLSHGVDPVRQAIPVLPAQHFLCGGIRTDRWGATDVTALFAVGEVAATGLHGANRLASNSLLEGMVFGRRVATRLSRDLPARCATLEALTTPIPRIGKQAITDIQSLMTRHAGVRRTGSGLDAASRALAEMVQPTDALGPMSCDAGNRWTVAGAIIAAASARKDSRGCHWRADHPSSSDGQPRHIVIRLDDDGQPAVAPTADLALERTA